jgi:hypothetical protein
MRNRRSAILCWTIFLIFLTVMTAYAFLTKLTGIHDAGEYITIAKEMAGRGNVEVFSAHPVIYPAFLSLFLRIFPSLIAIKIANLIIFAIIGFLLFKLLENKKAFLLWAFSPVVWFLSIEVSPVILVSLFVLLGYYFFDKWEKSEKWKFLLASGFCWGMTFSVWTASILLVLLFLLTFFWKKKFGDFAIFVFGIGIAVLLGFFADYLAFGFPFHSMIRYFGVNLVILAGLGQNHATLYPDTERLIRAVFCLVPLSFLAIRSAVWKNNKREVLFLAFCWLFFTLRGGLKEFLTFAPIWVIVVGKSLNWKKIMLNAVISIAIIVFLTSSYFTNDYQKVMEKDVEQFISDYDFGEVLTGKDQALNFAVATWRTEPKFLWWKEFELWKNKEEDYSSYYYAVNPNINQHEILYLKVGLKRKEERSFNGVPLISADKTTDYEGFKLLKEYPSFNVYLPEKSFQ